MRESTGETTPMYTCRECPRTFVGPLAANAHEDATGHVPQLVGGSPAGARGEGRTAKYRKTALVEAVQWFPGDEVAGVVWSDVHDCYVVTTLEGFSVPSPGDWILTGVQGEKWACKADIFAATYERAALPAPTTDATALRAAAEIGGAMFKDALESNGMYQRDGWIFTYTDAGDLGVWAARSFNEEADASAMFYGDDPEDDAFLWLANTRAALTSTPGAPTP